MSKINIFITQENFIKEHILTYENKGEKHEKITLLATAFTILMGAQIFVPNKSEAQIRCSTDFYGNTRCVDTNTGNSSNTRTDFYGNDNTTFSDGSYNVSCRTDFYGNYVCN